MAEILAFSAQQVCRLTGLSPRQLAYWDTTGFFSPTFAGEAHAAFNRIYTFRDVVGLRAIAQLREQHHIPLQQLRLVGSYLRDRYTEPWSQVTFYIVGKMVFFRGREADEIADRRGQTVLPFAMSKVESGVRLDVSRLRRRTPKQIGQIIRNRHLAENKPVLAGTRTSTGAIWDFYEAGVPPQKILCEFPHLTRQDVDAAIRYERRRRKQIA